MKKIIEMSTLITLMIAIFVIDINIYNKATKKIEDDKLLVTKKYEQTKKDPNKITLVTLDNFLINEFDKEEERKYQEYQAYLKTLIVYDGMTMDELAAKLDRSLKNELNGYGYLYASYALEKGVDPYIAVAISLHETGCNGHCSNLMKSCNNVGGQKGSPRCGDGAYKRFDTLEEGIKGFIDNLSKNYFGMGLNTPELMASKYAGSTTWPEKVNYYIEKIKSR